jgi:hypothetical protein
MVGVSVRNEPMGLPPAHVERQPWASQKQSVIPVKHEGDPAPGVALVYA